MVIFHSYVSLPEGNRMSFKRTLATVATSTCDFLFWHANGIAGRAQDSTPCSLWCRSLGSHEIPSVASWFTAEATNTLNLLHLLPSWGGLEFIGLVSFHFGIPGVQFWWGKDAGKGAQRGLFGPAGSGQGIWKPWEVGFRAATGLSSMIKVIHWSMFRSVSFFVGLVWDTV